MTKKDYLETWGFLQALKDIIDGKAKAAAQRTDETSKTLAADYTRQAAEIHALQKKIQQAADSAPE